MTASLSKGGAPCSLDEEEPGAKISRGALNTTMNHFVRWGPSEAEVNVLTDWQACDDQYPVFLKEMAAGRDFRGSHDFVTTMPSLALCRGRLFSQDGPVAY
jgi:hypothetical protein